MPSASGDQVLAPAPGVVMFVGRVVDRGVLTIRHGDGTVSSFEPITSQLTRNQAVGAGEVIGVTDAGGHCASGCLHVGARVADNYVDPEPYFVGRRRAVLIPLGDFAR